ncbi:MAG: hypothetical protein K2J30_03355 [Clostridia bacterium]|nr:hypothetical protein [Clostridia bacterium]
MKKRIFFAICMTALAGALSLSACGGKNVYKKLNELAEKDYDEVRLKVTTETDGETLHASYRAVSVAEGITVTYSCEQLNPIGTDENGDYVLPDTAITTLQGEILVKDGKTVKVDGDDIALSPQTVTAAGLRFSADIFEDEETTDTSFKAKVNSPAAFLRESNLVASNMTVVVEYTDRALTSLMITYTTQTGSVTMQYTFA